jgi:hypothetical protein
MAAVVRWYEVNYVADSREVRTDIASHVREAPLAGATGVDQAGMASVLWERATTHTPRGRWQVDHDRSGVSHNRRRRTARHNDEP